MRSHSMVTRAPNKQTILYVCTVFFLLASIGGALGQQAVPALERVVSIEFQSDTEAEALKKLSQRTGVTFSYSSSLLDPNRKIQLNIESKSLRVVLEGIFEGRLQFKQRGNYIILSKAPEPKKKTIEDPPLTISGYVVDVVDGEKVAQASVYDRATLSAAVTDQYGYFKMTIDKPIQETRLSVSKIFYLDTVVAVNGQSFMTIGLTPEPIEVIQPEVIRIRRDTFNIDSLRNQDLNIDTMATANVDSLTRRQKIAKFTNKILSKFRINMQNIRDTLYRPFQVSFVPFVGTNSKLSGNVVNDYSFNILGGHSKGVRKFEFGGLFNINEGDVSKVQLAGIFNKNGGTMDGWQMGGIFNINNHARGATQIAGIFNLNNTADLKTQVAGLINLQNSDAPKVQIAGLFNTNGGKSSGAQVAGLANFNGKPSSGFQLAGLINYNAGKTGNRVTQLAGLVNYAHTVNGAQIGLFNVADSVDGVSVGFLSFVAKGYHKIEISADEVFYTNISFRTGVRQFYNIITAGIKPGDSENFWTVGYGFGTAPRLSRTVFLNFDLTTNQVSRGRFTTAVNLVNKLYAGLDVRITKKISMAGGVTLNAYVTDLTYADYPELFTDYSPRIIYEHTYTNDANVKMWWGAKLGIRFL